MKVYTTVASKFYAVAGLGGAGGLFGSFLVGARDGFLLGVGCLCGTVVNLILSRKEWLIVHFVEPEPEAEPAKEEKK